MPIKTEKKRDHEVGRAPRFVRKSAAELAIIPSVRRTSAYDPQPPAHEPSPPPAHLQPEYESMVDFDR